MQFKIVISGLYAYNNFAYVINAFYLDKTSEWRWKGNGRRACSKLAGWQWDWVLGC